MGAVPDKITSGGTAAAAVADVVEDAEGNTGELHRHATPYGASGVLGDSQDGDRSGIRCEGFNYRRHAQPGVDRAAKSHQVILLRQAAPAVFSIKRRRDSSRTAPGDG